MTDQVPREEVGDVVRHLALGFMDITFHEVISQVNVNY